MSAVDLLTWARIDLLRRAEQHQAFEATSRFVAEHGLDWIEIEACAGLLAVMPVLFDEGRFEFRDGKESKLAVVVEVLGEDAETVVDLAVWPVAQPDHVRTMFGRAPMLGLAAATNPSTYFLDRPLRVFRSATEWLRAGGIGCVVIDECEAARILLDAPGRFAGEDLEHCLELRSIVESLFDPTRVVCPMKKAA